MKYTWFSRHHQKVSFYSEQDLDCNMVKPKKNGKEKARNLKRWGWTLKLYGQSKSKSLDFIISNFEFGLLA